MGECECECVEVQGAPEGRAPREITFRSLLTKDTHAELNYLQCNPSSDSSAQKSRGKALGRPYCEHWVKQQSTWLHRKLKEKQNIK